MNKNKMIMKKKRKKRSLQKGKHDSMMIQGKCTRSSMKNNADGFDRRINQWKKKKIRK